METANVAAFVLSRQAPLEPEESRVEYISNGMSKLREMLKAAFVGVDNLESVLLAINDWRGRHSGPVTIVGVKWPSATQFIVRRACWIRDAAESAGETEVPGDWLCLLPWRLDLPDHVSTVTAMVEQEFSALIRETASTVAAPPKTSEPTGADPPAQTPPLRRRFVNILSGKANINDSPAHSDLSGGKPRDATGQATGGAQPTTSMSQEEKDAFAMGLVAQGKSLVQIAKLLRVNRQDFYLPGGGSNRTKWPQLWAGRDALKDQKLERQERTPRRARDSRTGAELAAQMPDQCS
jgi:hypothetical protein